MTCWEWKQTGTWGIADMVKVKTGNLGEPRIPSTPNPHQYRSLFFEYSELHPHGCFLEVWMLCRKDVRNVFTRSPWKTSKKTWETDIPTRELWAEKGSLPRRRTASRRTLRRSDSWTHCEISGYTTFWESHSKDCPQHCDENWHWPPWPFLKKSEMIVTVNIFSASHALTMPG